MRVRPVSRESLIDSIATEAIDRAGGDRLRVAIDGAIGLEPDVWAQELVEELRDRGGFALHVSIRDFLLPASLRFEFGRYSPEAFYEGWRDEGGLRREVLDPAAPAGGDDPAAGGHPPGRVLPALWRTDIDRSARADYVTVPPGGIVVVSGEFLLGSGLPFEYTVHLTCSPAALARRTPAEEQWTLPAYARYAEEVAPETFADVVVRLEDPRRPAVVEA